MRINVELIKIAQLDTDKIDFDRVIFKIQYPRRVDIENSRSIFILLNTIVKGGAKKLLIDIHDLDYIDSSGLGSLISVAKLIRQNKGDLVLSGTTSNVMSILKVVNLPEFILMFNSEGEAINHFQAL